MNSFWCVFAEILFGICEMQEMNVEHGDEILPYF